MFKKIFLYLSSYIPIIFIIIIKDFIILLMAGIKNNDYSLLLNWNLIGVFIVLLVTIITFIVSIFGNRKLTIDRVKIINISNKTNDYYAQYFSMFILSLLGFSFLNLVDIIVFVLILLVLGIVYIKNGLFYINPTLNLLNNYIYVVDYESNGKIIRDKIVLYKKKLNNNSIIDLYVSDFEFTIVKNEVKNETRD